MKKIYVGCSIIHASKEYSEEIATLKNAIRNEPDCEVIEFVASGTGTPRDVYLNDIHNAVERCDFMVAEVSYPSLGLGFEIATMVEKLRKPVLLCAKEGMKVSRLIQGAAGPENPNCTFVWYRDKEDLLNKIKERLSTI